MQYTKDDLFIRNLPADITKEILLAHFERHGFPLHFAWLIQRRKKFLTATTYVV
jgi:RNA recognition motif-containing protein